MIASASAASRGSRLVFSASGGSGPRGHKVSGQFWGNYLQQHVFEPLNMKHTRAISETDIIPNRAAG